MKKLALKNQALFDNYESLELREEALREVNGGFFGWSSVAFWRGFGYGFAGGAAGAAAYYSSREA